MSSALKGLGCFCEKRRAAHFDPVAKDNGTLASLLAVNLREVDVASGGEEEHGACKRILSVFRLLYLLATDSFKDDLMNKLEELQNRSGSW